jgi:hypothetical protein
MRELDELSFRSGLVTDRDLLEGPRPCGPARRDASPPKWIWLIVSFFAVSAFGTPTAPVDYPRDVQPLLENYCYDCHGNGKAKSGLALDSYHNAAEIRAARAKWEGVLRNVSSHVMPPDDGGPIPSDEERDLISRFVEQELFQLDPAHPDPGRVVLRRLNRAEYNATIRDLVGVDFKPADDFPPDDSGYGFDNIGDVLTLPPVLLEKYLAAADKVMDSAIVTDPIHSEVRHIPASLAAIGFNAIGDRGDGWVQLISLEEDDAAVELALPAGDYLFRVQAYSTAVGGAVVGQGSEKPLEFADYPGPTKFALLLDDTFVKNFDLGTDPKRPGVYEARLGVPAGKHRFRGAVLRNRGGQFNESFMLNGRLGRQQPGIVYAKWLEIEGPLPTATRRYRADKLAVTGEGRFTPAGERVLLKNGDVSVDFATKRETEVILRAQAYAQQAGSEPARMEFRIDGRPLSSFDVLAPATAQPLPKQHVFSLTLLVAQPRVYEHRLKLPAGRHRFSAAFVNDFTDPKNSNPNLTDRNLIIQSLEIADLSQPVITPEKPEPIAQLFAGATGKSPADARRIVGQFAYRAWRRPVQPAEIDRLMKLYDTARAQGDGFEAGVKLALKATLISPNFLFIGSDNVGAPLDDARGRGQAAPLQTEPIDEFTLASRLSYFLWSSLPDEELLDLAARGQLRAQLPAQVKRLLASPKSRALVENFAGQWLQTRSLENFSPDKQLFPEYDPVLRAAMQRETEMFFEYVMRADRSLFDFLTGDYTFVNARLAKLYDLPGVTGDEFQKVSLAGTPRRGVLTHASVLTLTSNPTRTSPVKRGKWVLENLLGTPPPPPPPNIPELDDKTRKLTGTLRQQLEQHRTNATCASCHARMDPIGFGLENFNAIGGYREKDGSAPVDSSGQLASGDKFSGAAELAQVLAGKKRFEFLRCMADRTLTYALGRGTEYYDRPAIEQIVKQVEANDDKFSALMLAVAQSFPFQNQRMNPPPAATPAEQ